MRGREGETRCPAAIATHDIDLDDLPGNAASLRIRPEGPVFVGVAMNADGSPGVDFGAKVEARIPILHRLAIWGLILGGVLAAIATALLTGAARSRVATPA